MLTRRELLLGFTASAFAGTNHPVRKGKIEPLFKSPDGNPNGLESTEEGLWVAEQVSDVAYLLDWKTGKVLRKVETESSNTSGIAYGGGFLWMAANGPARNRPARPHDATSGEVVKIDATSGKTVARYPIPGGGGVHGLIWVANSLWITALKLQKLIQVDVNFKELHSIPVTLTRAHGLGWDGKSIWCLFSNDLVIHRLDPKDGRILEAVQLSKEDPDPHGLTWERGSIYYCDAGIAPSGKSNESKFAGYVCRIHL